MMRCAHLVSAGLFLIALAPLSAQPLTPIELEADPWQGKVSWQPDIGTPVSYEGAVHGMVKINGAELTYSPTPGGDFWTVGSDRLLVNIVHPDLSLTTQRLTVLAGSPTEGPQTTHFEGEPLPFIQGLDTQVFIRPDGAVLGTQGAHIVLDGSGAPAYMRYRVDEAFRGDPDNTDAGCADLRMGVDGPGRHQLPGCFGSSDGSGCAAIGILSAVTADDDELFRIEAGISSTEVHLRAIAFDASRAEISTPWITTSAVDHAVRLDWWTGVDGGLRLRIDGRVRAELRGISTPNLEVYEMRIGAPINPLGSDLELAIDAVTVREGQVDHDPQTLSGDDFEQDLTSWDAMGLAAGNLSVSPSAALGGNAGLEIALTGPGAGWGAWLLDEAPNQETTIGLRFRLDTSDFHLGNHETMSLLLGQTTNGPSVQSRFLIRLWKSPTGTKIRASAFDNDGDRFDLPYVLLSAGSQLVELEWRAASEPDSFDGRLRMWLDGVLTGELTTLDNDAALIESLRFGAMYLQPLTDGTLLLDEFEAWR